jgi:hypothetical protein
MAHRISTIGRAGKAIALTAAGLVGGYWALFGWMVYSSPLSYAEMDINRDGKVEFFRGGLRVVVWRKIY